MKNNSGMSLIEVLIALAIVFIIFMGLSNAGLVVLDQNIKNSQRDEAVSVADNVMQQTRNIPFANLVTGTTTDNVFLQVRGINQQYGVTRVISWLDTENRQVTVTVAWTRFEYGQPRQYTHQIMTILRQR